MATYKLERLFTDSRNQNNSNRKDRRNNNQQSNKSESSHSNRHNNQHGSQHSGKTNNASQRKLVEIDTKKVLKGAGLGLAAAGLVAGGTYGVYKLAKKIDKNKEDARKDRSRNRMVRGLGLDTPHINK